MSNAPLAALSQDIDQLDCLGLNRAEKPVTSRTWAGEPDLRALADDCNLVVLAADQPGEIRAWANRACLAAGTPWIDAGYHGPTPHAAAFLPGRGACYECLCVCPATVRRAICDSCAVSSARTDPSGARSAPPAATSSRPARKAHSGPVSSAGGETAEHARLCMRNPLRRGSP